MGRKGEYDKSRNYGTTRNSQPTAIFKYDETGLLEERDHRGKFLQFKRFPDKNQHVDSGGSTLFGPFSRFCWTPSAEVLQVRSTSTSISSKECLMKGLHKWKLLKL
jgi:hypothetical protein